MDNRGDFQRLRFKLYDTRKILEAQQDPIWDSIRYLSITSKKRSEEEYVLTIGPSDQKVKGILSRLGFGSSSESDDLLDPTKE